MNWTFEEYNWIDKIKLFENFTKISIDFFNDQHFAVIEYWIAFIIPTLTHTRISADQVNHLLDAFQ